MSKKTINPEGYRCKKVPGHPRASTGGNVLLHVLLAEKALGKYLPEGAEVHHHNGIRSDNRNENLVICEDRAYHFLIHARSRIVQVGGDPNIEKICGKCRTVVSRSDFHRNSRAYDGLNQICAPCNRKHAEFYRAKARSNA